MRRGIWIGLVACGVLSVPVTADAKPDKKCQRRLDLLEKRLVAIPDHIGFGLPPMTIELPSVAKSTEVHTRGVIIDVKGEQVGIEGLLAEGDTLDAKLARLKQVDELLQDPTAPAYLRIDVRTPLKDALPLMCKVAKKRAVHLVVRNPNAKPTNYKPPEPSEAARAIITDLMRRTDPAERAKLLTTAFVKAIEGCDPLKSVVSAVYVAVPEERTYFLKRAILDGTRACNCRGIDVDTIESLVILMSAPVSPPTHAFVPKIPCGQEKPYGLSMDETFGALVEKMAAGL